MLFYPYIDLGIFKMSNCQFFLQTPFLNLCKSKRKILLKYYYLCDDLHVFLFLDKSEIL